jgi:hypothetical protein
VGSQIDSLFVSVSRFHKIMSLIFFFVCTKHENKRSNNLIFEIHFVLCTSCSKFSFFQITDLPSSINPSCFNVPCLVEQDSNGHLAMNRLLQNFCCLGSKYIMSDDKEDRVKIKSDSPSSEKRRRRKDRRRTGEDKLDTEIDSCQKKREDCCVSSENNAFIQKVRTILFRLKRFLSFWTVIVIRHLQMPSSNNFAFYSTYKIMIIV